MKATSTTPKNLLPSKQKGSCSTFVSHGSPALLGRASISKFGSRNKRLYAQSTEFRNSRSMLLREMTRTHGVDVIVRKVRIFWRWRW